MINLGSNFEISIGELARTIGRLMNISFEIETENQRERPEKSEVERLFSSNEKALRLLDWAPEYAGLNGLERGLQKTIAWFLKPENLSRYKPDLYNV